MKKSIIIVALIISMSSPLFAQSDADQLAKALANPVAALISVPFQGNFDFGQGPSDGTKMTLNIQPVIPQGISEDWNLITRVILPVISQNDVFGPSGSQTGLGDTFLNGFFSPKATTKSGWIWGAGPMLVLPTGTDPLLGIERFGAGPTGVALKQQGAFTYGMLLNHFWTFAGNEDRNHVENTFIQPFIVRGFSGGYTLALNTEANREWNAKTFGGNIHLVGSKVITLGSQMAQVSLGPRIPYGDGAGSFGFRAQFILLFPAM